ncbi:hypothetical protein EDB84DRAFT_1424117 [Lactarius hengduanensis]|nr:hypothetical protein EDB84DRAFT_1424117 [Lactarius hengduanensis]
MSKTIVSPTVSPPLSPPHSGATSPVQSRRVLQRRGSTTAADPWGAHLELNMNPGRTTSCKLTIVRVNPAPQIQLDERPPSPQQQRRHFSIGSHPQNPHRRHGSHGHSVTGKGENTRMSFASASFAPPGSPTGPGPRPGSPTHGHGHGLHRHSSAPKPRLSADQIISLAQQSCNPQSAPSSPRTPGGSLTAAARSGRTSFTAIPDDVFLPFVDRTDEVKALFTSPQPGARLFALLAQTFAPQTASESPVTNDAVFATDPRKWSSAQLEFWMKCVDRDTAPDEVWVGLIRRCVLFHSELIWERIKGALGAPPELDPDGFEEDPFTADKPLTFSDFKLESLEDFVSSPTEDHPPVPDTTPHPQPAPDHASESNVSAPAEDSPGISALTIEPVLMPSSPTGEHDHPPTRPGGHRMHDISEDVREESSENEDEELSEPAGPSLQRGIIQGLRISTVPATPGIFAGDSPHTRLLRTSSMSSVNQLQQQQQPKTPDEYPSPPRRSSMSSLGRRWSYAASNASSEVYDVVGERGPGNPLFPTSFARLALGPTLSANNPALRSQNFPPAPAFSNPHSIRASVVRGRRGKPSWAEGWDPSKHEYAVTASEGSVGGH